jgi:hypothetical protein
MKHYDVYESDEGGYDLYTHMGYKFEESDCHYIWCEDLAVIAEYDKTVKCNCNECREWGRKNKIVNEALAKGITGEFRVINDYKFTPTINGISLIKLNIHR